MKILLTGATGQVGRELTRALTPLGDISAPDRTRCDLAQTESLRPVVREVRPDVIVNAAAYTAVDKAEQEESLATVVNGHSVGVLAEEARQLGALLVHYSTDYVFNGAKDSPYFEDDAPHPLNAYGRSKLAGEAALRGTGCAHLVLRTSWVYAAHGHNFVRTVLRLLHERDELNIVTDQIGSPTSAHDIAEATASIVRQAVAKHAGQAFVSGTYHLAAAGSTSWHGFAVAIAKQAVRRGLIDPGRMPRIHPIPSAQFPLPAVRPANSRLNCDRLRQAYGIAMPAWQSGIEYVMQAIAAEEALAVK